MTRAALILALVVPLSFVLASAHVDGNERVATPATDGGQKEGDTQASQIDEPLQSGNGNFVEASFLDSRPPIRPGSLPTETSPDIEITEGFETIPQTDDTGANQPTIPEVDHERAVNGGPGWLRRISGMFKFSGSSPESLSITGASGDEFHQSGDGCAHQSEESRHGDGRAGDISDAHTDPLDGERTISQDMTGVPINQETGGVPISQVTGAPITQESPDTETTISQESTQTTKDETASKPVQSGPGGAAAGTNGPRDVATRYVASLAAISLAAAAYKTLPAVLATSSKKASPVPTATAAGPAVSRNMKMGGVLGAAVGIMALTAGSLFNKTPMKKSVPPAKNTKPPLSGKSLFNKTPVKNSVPPAKNTKPPLSGKSPSTGLVVLASLMGVVAVVVASALALAYYRRLKNREQTLAPLDTGASTDVDDIYAGEIDRV
ncbi:Uncharacterized protein PBTT_08863 [Plasmodiophora brassicae]